MSKSELWVLGIVAVLLIRMLFYYCYRSFFEHIRTPPYSSSRVLPTGFTPSSETTEAIRKATAAWRNKAVEHIVLPESIVISKHVDEQLYLVRMVEHLYDSWPTDELRMRAVQLRQHVEDEDLDPALAEMFQDYHSASGAYLDFLDQLDGIEAETANSGIRDDIAGGPAFAGHRDGGAATPEATGTATEVFELWNRVEKRDQAKVAAMSQAAKAVDALVESSWVRARKLAHALAEKNRWQIAETGFEPDRHRLEHADEFAARGDHAPLQQMARAEAERRPRDAQAQLLAALNFDLAGPPEDSGLALAEKVMHAASLIPGHSVYDFDRQTFVTLASGMVSMERNYELDTGAPLDGRSQSSREAVRLWRMAQSFGPDGTGRVRQQLAWSLYSNGQTTEALAVAEEVSDLRQHDATYYYYRACILSALQQDEAALAALERAIDLGWSSTAMLRNDPRLARLRQAQSTAFQKLVELKWSWSIRSGLLSDDISLTNQSRFPMTNVVLNVDLQQDQRNWQETLGVDAIAPGATHVWRNALSVSGGRPTSSEATLNCDQSTTEPFTIPDRRSEVRKAREKVQTKELPERLRWVQIADALAYATSGDEKVAAVRRDDIYQVLDEGKDRFLIEVDGRQGWVPRASAAERRVKITAARGYLWKDGEKVALVRQGEICLLLDEEGNHYLVATNDERGLLDKSAAREISNVRPR